LKRALLGASAVTALLGFAVAAYADVQVIPPSNYNPGCHPNGKARQGDADADRIAGTPRRDLLRGGGGADSINGRGARDCLFGGLGADFIRGSGGKDRVKGGGGKDNIRGSGGRDRVKGRRGDDAVRGGKGDDANFGGKGDDAITDLRDRNRIDCGSGFDTVFTNQQSVTQGCEDVTRR
jgi:Ca2+-binding RTX toxin-like protein